MHIENVRHTWLQTALAALMDQFTRVRSTVIRKDRVEPDPGGMRDEMEREFISRVSRESRYSR